MRKIFTTLFCTFLLTNLCQAQNYQHYTWWSRVALQKKLSDHWTVGGELHWRRQNDFQSSSISPFALELTEGIKGLAIYRIKEVAFSFEPFFLNSHPLNAKESDLKRTDRLEIRPVVFAEWLKPLSKKFIFRSRLGYEYRIFKRTDGLWGDEQGRLRVRFQLRYLLDKKNTVYISEEDLFNVVPNVPANTFSQNQLYFAYIHAFSPHFSTEIGYIWNHRQRATLVEFDEENILQTQFVFRF
jgi:hypothetical protein